MCQPQRIQVMKPPLLLLLVSALFQAASPGAAAILIGPTGSGILTFDTLPAVGEWSTQSIGGEGDNAIILNASTFDAEAQKLSASQVNLALAATAAVPPLQNNYGRWNSSAYYLQTRIGNNEYTVLMATLQNFSGLDTRFLTVSCDVGGGAFIPEQVPGYRMYFSLTGSPGSWQNVPELSTGT